MFYLIGVAHRVQAKLVEEPQSEDQARFCDCVEDTIHRFRPALIAEEFSQEALVKLNRERGVIHESITKVIAERSSIEHRFCDPDAAARERMGYREGSDIALQIAMGDCDGLSSAEISDRGFAIEVLRYWPLRERFWLDSIADAKKREVVFICGDANIVSFQNLLNHKSPICRCGKGYRRHKG